MGLSFIWYVLLKAETLDQVNKFLLRNKNFSVLKFSKNKNVTHYNNFIKDNLMLTHYPQQ